MLITAAQIGLGFDDFWRLTPREFNLMVRGYGKRIEQTQELLAWHAANIINAIPGSKNKKVVKPADLLGRRNAIPQSAEEFKKMMRERAE